MVPSLPSVLETLVLQPSPPLFCPLYSVLCHSVQVDEVTEGDPWSTHEVIKVGSREYSEWCLLGA